MNHAWTRGAPRRAPLLAVAALALALGLGACAGAPQATLADDAAEPAPAEARVEQDRLVLRALGSHPRAEETRGELARASKWLDQAESLAAAPEPDGRRVRLLLDAVEGQLVMVKTWYDRRAAEEAAGVRQAPLVEVGRGGAP